MTEDLITAGTVAAAVGCALVSGVRSFPSPDGGSSSQGDGVSVS